MAVVNWWWWWWWRWWWCCPPTPWGTCIQDRGSSQRVKPRGWNIWTQDANLKERDPWTNQRLFKNYHLKFKTWTLGDARMERWEVDEGIRGDKEVGEKSAEILLHSIYDYDDDDSPDNVEVTKKDTAKGDTEDKNVSSHWVITFWWPWSWLSAVIRNQNYQEIHRSQDNAGATWSVSFGEELNLWIKLVRGQRLWNVRNSISWWFFCIQMFLLHK